MSNRRNEPKLSDEEMDKVIEATVSFTQFVFGHGPDESAKWLAQLTPKGRAAYFVRCDEVMVLYRASLSKKRPS